MIKRLFTFALILFCARSAHALAISGVTFSQDPVTFETGGVPNGTTIGFTLDQAGLVQIAVNCGIVNFGDTGNNVANLNQLFSVATSTSMFWNGLWLIGGDFGRNATTCDFTLTFSSAGTSVNPVPAPTNLVHLNSVDIHNLSVTSSVSAAGAATFPYAISYDLAKHSNVTATITNSSNTIVRTLLKNVPQAAETVSTITVTWDGLADSGNPVPLGVYTLTVSATDPAVTGSVAIPRTRSIVVQSLAGAGIADPQKLFENNAYVYPNPVRNGSATFQLEAIRDGANLSLRIYTMTGDLVREQKYFGLAGGTIETFPWDVTNQSGNKLGRGLYYYVVREDDNVGTLQTVKKMAVLP
jgi:flagellar hook assembly protein FlgD